MRRLGFLMLVPVFFLLSLAATGGEKLKQPAKKKIVLPTTALTTVELKDGTTVVCELTLAHTLTIRTPDLGSVTLKFDLVRFVDFEGPMARVSTHALETFYGTIETELIRGRLPATGKEVALRRAGLRRIVFPEALRELVLP